ncbi:hypothetical protein SteCoe_31729 [Stentor coeruleus]|uniref:CFA20 domain-containing protein n=1 Tax=Stentor coeruleus TaxID=5963 RepID=A0A1R2B0R5_9CILI|nr:hypothetical protein SteCoe_31729 [Stentor coeruleus]
MFQNAFQAGPSVEVLYSCDKNPIWSINKPNWKFYEKSVKGYIILIDSHNTKLNIPSNDKQTLALVQPFLVLQIFIMPSQPFTLELVITDISNTKRRLVFSSTSKELITTPAHARIPNIVFARGTWANISIDMTRIVNLCFANTFRSLDSITISSFCKLKRIFTMKNPLVDTSGSEVCVDNPEGVPKNVNFLPGVTFVNQIITYQNVLTNTHEHLEIKNTPKKAKSRPPLTTAPIEKLKRPELRTSSLNKKQGSTTTAFFQKKKEPSSPKGKLPPKLPKPEISNQNALNSSSSHRSTHKTEEKKQTKDENTHKILLETQAQVIEEDINTTNFNHLTNYRDNDDAMSNSILEEIEIESCQQDTPETKDLEPDHNYFPRNEIKNEAPKPTFFSSGMNQVTQHRPFTPPFAGLNSMKNIHVSNESPQDEAVELIYDPILQCYYDPTTMEYYQVND